VNTNPGKIRGGWNGVAVVAMAGPFSNVVFAVILGILAAATAKMSPGFALYAARGVSLSLYLAMLNMIPVPPLDGSKLLLAARIPAFIYREIAQFGFLLVLLLVSYTNVGYQMSAWSIQGTERILGLFQ
jgi:Zn-dependent protease